MATSTSDTALVARTTMFRDLPLHADVGHALTTMLFRRPSPIQLHALPVAMFGNDVIGQAKSGTGKTAVFGVAAIEYTIRQVEQQNQKIEGHVVGIPLALILAPTREIAVQIESVLRQLAQFRPDIVIRTCIGGLSVAQDQIYLAAGCHIVVGTPGRVKALVDQHSLPCSAIRLLVLDEVDKLMARDFEKDIVRVRRPDDVTTEFISSAEDLENWKKREQSNSPELWLPHCMVFCNGKFRAEALATALAAHAPEDTGDGENAEEPSDGVAAESFSVEGTGELCNYEGSDDKAGLVTCSAAAEILLAKETEDTDTTIIRHNCEDVVENSTSCAAKGGTEATLSPGRLGGADRR
ncbi:DEAD/DEAH box RNA helicase, putative [Phytophthora infestans T30-4]|uniref:DEAD/DEAH box RNA helicase, putative n=1 Tax=Phytophthora infestans (strain T30-4) TaxID=403677 RepID=D0NW40_PHYIT|nr:DEAD/DEAH box RNA helicase, putative [Phytophthora infestans T30-4]EEY66882.1 DEAD/DEAH box RNA helicase, putative [Phytophthora infestans T30-4]|eukprot:XP_002896691.1 DEAD/DEAH box RNA helicase, putative [Phytophthora infestans T30-4]